MKIVKWTFGAIGAYLVLNYYTGFGKDVNAVAGGATSGIKVLQGRG